MSKDTPNYAPPKTSLKTKIKYGIGVFIILIGLVGLVADPFPFNLLGLFFVWGGLLLLLWDAITVHL